MLSRHKTVHLDDALDGMVLGADVLDHQGAVLLPKGKPLTESLLGSLRRRGIDYVAVLDAGVCAQQLAQERERIAARLAHLFRHCAGQPACAEVLRALLAYRLEHLE